MRALLLIAALGAVLSSAVGAGEAVAGASAAEFETVAEMELEEQADFSQAAKSVEFGLYDVSLTPPS